MENIIITNYKTYLALSFGNQAVKKQWQGWLGRGVDLRSLGTQLERVYASGGKNPSLKLT